MREEDDPQEPKQPQPLSREHSQRNDLHGRVAQVEPDAEPDMDPQEEVRRELDRSFEQVEPEEEEYEPPEHGQQADWAPGEYLPQVVYRWDSRSPEEIGRTGFIAKGNDMDLLEHA